MWTFGLNRALELEAIVFAKSARSGVPNHCQIDKRYFSVTRFCFILFPRWCYIFFQRVFQICWHGRTLALNCWKAPAVWCFRFPMTSWPGRDAKKAWKLMKIGAIIRRFVTFCLYRHVFSGELIGVATLCFPLRFPGIWVWQRFPPCNLMPPIWWFNRETWRFILTTLVTLVNLWSWGDPVCSRETRRDTKNTFGKHGFYFFVAVYLLCFGSLLNYFVCRFMLFFCWFHFCCFYFASFHFANIVFEFRKIKHLKNKLTFWKWKFYP